MSTFSQNDLVQAVLAVLGRDIKEIENAFGKPIEGISLPELNFDSLSILELAIFIEENHGITVNPTEFPFRAEARISDLFAFISTRAT